MKNSVYRKHIALFVLSLLTILLVPLVKTSNTIETTEVTRVRIIPTIIASIEPGSTFTVACVVENIEDLSGLDIQILWNTTMLTYVNHTVTMTVEDFPDPIPPSPYAGIMHDPPLPLMDQVNTTAGTYWVAFASLGGPAFNGNGTVFIMNFEALELGGVTVIEFTHVELARDPSAGGGSIPHTRVDCIVYIEGAPLILNVFRTPLVPEYDEEVVISANVSDLSLDQVILSYSYALEWRNVSMTEFGGLFNASIPPQPYNTMVEYKVYANDTNGYDSESELYFYLVGDSIPPNIVDITWTPTSPTPLTPLNKTRAGEPVLVTSSQLEPVNASGVDTVLLKYRVDLGMWWNTTMLFNETSGQWIGVIPGQLQNASVEFFVEAWDIAGNSNVSSTYLYNVRMWLIGDIDGDGEVSIFDIVKAAHNYRQSIP